MCRRLNSPFHHFLAGAPHQLNPCHKRIASISSRDSIRKISMVQLWSHGSSGRFQCSNGGHILWIPNRLHTSEDGESLGMVKKSCKNPHLGSVPKAFPNQKRSFHHVFTIFPLWFYCVFSISRSWAIGAGACSFWSEVSKTRGSITVIIIRA